MPSMSPQRRTALVSVGAACLLIAIKLAAGLASGSLGLLAEAAHSGADLGAALLTFFAVSVAVRPADPGHPFGHGKAQNLAALAEAALLVAISLVIGAAAIARLLGVVESEVEATWWGERRSTAGKRKSWSDHITLSAAKLKSGPRQSGTATCQKTPMWLARSRIAASTS